MNKPVNKIPTLTESDITKFVFTNPSGQCCALGWIGIIHHCPLTSNSEKVVEFARFLKKQGYFSKKDLEKIDEGESPIATIARWNDRRSTPKATIATALNEFNRLLQKAKVARKRKATLAAKKK